MSALKMERQKTSYLRRENVVKIAADEKTREMLLRRGFLPLERTVRPARGKKQRSGGAGHA